MGSVIHNNIKILIVSFTAPRKYNMHFFNLKESIDTISTVNVNTEYIKSPIPILIWVGCDLLSVTHVSLACCCQWINTVDG